MKIAGIDVSSKPVTLVIDQAGQTGKPREFKNTPEGHVGLSKVLGPGQPRRPGGHQASTTSTWRSPWMMPGLDVMVINPKATKRCAEAMQTRTKTDAMDAALLALAQFAQRLPFEPWQRSDAPALAIRAGARHIAALNKLLTQTKNQLHTTQLTALTPGFVIASLQQIDRLPRSPDRAPAPPVPFSSSANSWSCLTTWAPSNGSPWLDSIHVHTSPAPASIKKPRRSKAGNRYLRIALFTLAPSAARHDINVRTYYQHLIENRDLKKLQARCAVVRKLLHAIHAMLKNRTPFDSRRFYSPPKRRLISPVYTSEVNFWGSGSSLDLHWNRVSTGCHGLSTFHFVHQGNDNNHRPENSMPSPTR